MQSSLMNLQPRLGSLPSLRVLTAPLSLVAKREGSSAHCRIPDLAIVEYNQTRLDINSGWEVIPMNKLTKLTIQCEILKSITNETLSNVTHLRILGRVIPNISISYALDVVLRCPMLEHLKLTSLTTGETLSSMYSLIFSILVQCYLVSMLKRPEKIPISYLQLFQSGSMTYHVEMILCTSTKRDCIYKILKSGSTRHSCQ